MTTQGMNGRVLTRYLRGPGEAGTILPILRRDPLYLLSEAARRRFDAGTR